MRISDWSSDVCSSDLRLFDPIEPDVAIDAAVFVPILLDLDVKVEVDGVAEQRGKLGAGLGADFLDPAALLAEHDRALGGPRDEDLLVDFDRAVVAFLVRLGDRKSTRLNSSH